MANDVFANGLEIACKAGDGKSVACFPDVCFSPPSPPAGWIPIPYANTAYAKDTANASKTVFISGKPIMKKDVSYFKASTGNEPAAGPKGVITHVKKGKTYFASWSMNVKIEGENVDRHTDMTTHNHGSTSNTATWVYSDTGTKPPKECKADCIKIETACGKNVSADQAKEMCGDGKTGKKKKPDEKIKASNKNKGKLADLFKERLGDEIDNVISWKLKHCAGPLLINSCAFDKPGAIDEQIKSLSDQIKKELPKEIEDAGKKALKSLTSELSSEMWEDILVKAVIGYDLEKGFWRGVFRFAAKKIPYAGQIMSADEANEIRKEVNAIVEEINKGAAEQMERLGKEIQGKIDEVEKKIKELEKLKSGGMDKNGFLAMQKDAADEPCIKARKCNLVPYKDTDGVKGGSLLGKHGCCPGQTGHHLVPNSMIVYPDGEKEKTGKEKIDGCPGYKHGGAPTVCVEGTDQNECTHNEIHVNTKTRLEKKYDKPVGENEIKLGTATDVVEQAHKDTFGLSDCRSTKKGVKGCQEAQLENYFKKACGENWRKVSARAVDGMTRTEH